MNFKWREEPFSSEISLQPLIFSQKTVACVRNMIFRIEMPKSLNLNDFPTVLLSVNRLS